MNEQVSDADLNPVLRSGSDVAWIGRKSGWLRLFPNSSSGNGCTNGILAIRSAVGALLAVALFVLVAGMASASVAMDPDPLATATDLADSVNRRPGQRPNTLTLSAEEQAFLAQHPVLRVGVDNDWFPFDFIDDQGQHAGVAADFLARVAAHLGVHLEIVGDRPWADILDLMRGRELDMLAMASLTTERSEYALFSRPYIHSPMVIITRNDVDFLPSVAALGQRPVATVAGYASHEWLTRNHPELNHLEVTGTVEGLRRVASGELFALIDNLAVVTFLMRRYGLTNLKVSGKLPPSFDLSIAVRDDWPILFDLVQKALDAIPTEERAAIYERWIGPEIASPRDYSKILPFTGGLLLVLAVLSGYSWRLHSYRVTLQRTNERLVAAEDQLRKQNDILSRLSVTDALTGSFNRYKLDQALTDKISLAQRYQRPLSIILFDLDLFKLVNDSFGHQTGDEILRQFSECVMQKIRQSDIFGRWGGEEFMLISPETTLHDAVCLAEKIRERIALMPTPAEGLRLTVSAGVVEWQPGESRSELVQRCDMQLYAAKREGRNRVCHDCRAGVKPAAVTINPNHLPHNHSNPLP